MAAYIGLQEQIRSNNLKSSLILAGFPLLILAGVYAFFFFVLGGNEHIDQVNARFITTIPFVIGGVLIWFFIAYFANSSLIQLASNSRSLERKENMRVYNLTENLCMTVGMKMPQLFVIDSPALNAFASGINEKSYAVTLTTGIIDHLNDEELEAVIAHELTHIRNKDVRLLIVSIIFVGIISFLVQILFRSLLFGGGRRDKDDNKLVIVALVISLVALLLSVLFKFALSRKREYLADAGAVQMTRNSRAMASALRKISGHSEVSSVKSDDMKQMFIEHKALDGAGFAGLFATHPPIEKRIAVLEQM
ncbi:M48 family metallopeptidase [Fluviicola taffensis]|uniref:Protease HtpX homolog n=1 Tax=Fluviicola taffensis (strain DSM 16823 / NCIMB 13979 / RW262) TaxID=755732 RepID=F2IG23_FLUTR|nr:M48 family metallopeptidase [Fluviicola taffensis]AEA44658.1 Heat shock protein [Fluviicola taffensis DSM 16823]